MSIIGAFSLSFLKRWPSVPSIMLIAAAIFASEMPVMYTLPPILDFTEEQFMKNGEQGDYSFGPQFADRPFRMLTGWLKPHHAIDLDRWREITKATKGPIHLRVAGKVFEGMGKFDLEVGSYDEASLLDSAQIEHPDFDVVLMMQTPPHRVQLQTSHYQSTSSLPYPTFIRPDRVYLFEDPKESYIYSDSVDRIHSIGLKRIFKVKDGPAKLARPTVSSDFVIELPISYSPFLVARQLNTKISGWSDFNYRLNVRVSDLAAPIVVTYETPLWIRILSWSAFFAVIGLLVQLKRKQIRFSSN